MPTVVVTETISTHYIDASGNTYEVEVSYGPEAGIPSGAKLAVSELEGDEAEAYIGAALEAVENDGNNDANSKKTTLKYAKALDISILMDGVEVRPVAPISVSIKLLDAPNSDEFDEANVVHFGDEAEVVESNIQQEAVRFETDGFSVYVVTYTISTFYMDASGNTYSVEVSYGPEAGIPSGAKLAVSELEGDEAEAYAARAAEALNVNGSQVAYAKALDISILSDGAPVQPQTPVSVSIKLLDAPDPAETDSINVLHFGEEVETVDCALNGQVVAFEADGFSVYVVLKIEKRTFDSVVTEIEPGVEYYLSNGTGNNIRYFANTIMTYLLNNAVQTSDLSWKDFKTNTNAATTGIVLYSSGTGPTPAKATGAGNYYPVEPTNALTYDGKNHSVSGIMVSFDGTNGAGMFGTIPNNEDNPPAVSNLALIDFTIAQTGSGNAGALAGTLTNCTVNNVLAYNSTKAAAVNITATSGNAGGLIGSATKCTIQKSAAAVIVKSTSGNAGGLIGSTTQGTVTACYSGGHTSDAAYSKTDYNVTAGDNAGGLIGSVDSTPIDYCYSTCSATGAKVGGLVGTCAGTIKRSYCAGLVKSTAATPVEGAFAGTWTGMTKDDDNHYLAIINEWEVKDASDNITGYKDMNPVSGSETVVGLAAIDETVATFNDFCAPKDSEGNDLWKPAVPYDAKLIEYYGGKYNLKTVERLGATLKTGDTDTTEYFVATHYGDWPVPEIFVVNTKGTNATPATPTP